MVSSAASGGQATSRLPLVVVLLVALVCAASAVVLHHHSRGRIDWWMETRPIPAESIRAETGLCFVAPLGTDWLSSHARRSPARLIEDGRDLGPGNSGHQQVRELGGGRFSVWHGNLYFASSDGTDPRRNGRRYEIVWPHPVAPAWGFVAVALAILFGAFAVVLARRAGLAPLARLAEVGAPRAARLGAYLGSDDGRHAWQIAAAVAVIAFGARLVAYLLVLADPAGHISGGLIMGVPFSDAQGWDSQGESIHNGHGLVGMWSARRPFYAFVLGALYTWTGPSVIAVVLLHAVVGAWTAALVCRLGQRVVHPAAGVVGGIAFAFDPVSIEYSGLVLTETVGTFLFVVSLHQLVVALQEDRAAASWWSGVTLTLSNLTRTLTLPAAPLLALLTFWLGSRERRGWRRGAWLAALFSLGIALPLGAWIVRQKAVHDLTTISDNGAAALYAVASPRYGTWSPALDREAQEAGVPKDIRSRYDWYTRRFHEELAADPWVYVRNVVASGAAAVHGLGAASSPTRAAIVVLLVGLWLVRLRRIVASGWRAALWTAGVAACGWLVVGISGLAGVACALSGLLVASAGRRDRTPLLLVAGQVGTIASVALSGLGQEHRLLLMAAWVQPLGWAAVAVYATSALARWLGDAPSASAPAPAVSSWTPRGQRALGRALLVFALASLAFLSYRNYVAPKPLLPPLPRLDVPTATRLVDRLAELRPDLIRADERRPDGWYVHTATVTEQLQHHGELAVASARLSRHRYPIEAATRVTHWSRMFDVRPYDRVFCYAETALAAGHRGPGCMVFVAPVPPADRRDVVVVGRIDVDPAFVIEECYFEVLAWAPLDARGEVDMSALQVAAEPLHVTAVDALRR